MIVYIAGPMSGIVDQNYPAFNAAAAELEALGHTVLNPVSSEQHNDTGEPQTWSWYMRHALRMVSEADGIALLEGYHNSPGASLELFIGRKLGLDVRPLHRWLEETRL